MPDLVGSIAEYSGDDNEVVFVSVDAIAAQCTEYDTNVSDELRSVIGDACPGYFSSARAIFDRAQQVSQILAGNPLTVDPCTWLDYFAPLIFRGSLTVVQWDPIEHIAYWRLGAKTFRITGATVLPTGEVICYYGVWDKKEWLYKGVQPRVVATDTEQMWCGTPNLVNIVDKYDSALSAPQGDSRFLAGSTSITFLSDATEYHDPSLQYVPGGPFMPIPPIPDGFPALPVVPPLQGGAIVDALSDADCATIVERGGGFRNLTDIANYADGSSWEEFDDYTVRMLIPNERNLNYVRYVLSLIDVEFWTSVIPPQQLDGNPLTLGAVQQVFDAASNTAKTQWLRANMGNMNLLQVWDAFALGGNETLVRETSKIILKEVADAPLLVPSVIVDPTIEMSTLEASAGPAGEILLILTLAEKQMKNKVKWAQIATAECNGPASWDMVSTVFEDPETHLEFDNLGWQRWLTEAIEMLQRCCNPCREHHEDNVPNEDFWGSLVITDQPNKILGTQVYPDLYRVEIRVIRNKFPKSYEFGPPDLGLYAKFAWVDQNGNIGPIKYINIDGQVIYVDFPDTVKVMVHCYPGVELEVSYYTRNEVGGKYAYYDDGINPPILP